MNTDNSAFMAVFTVKDGNIAQNLHKLKLHAFFVCKRGEFKQ